MSGQPPGHSHRFTIADHDAVHALFEKLNRPQGSKNVDAEGLSQAMNDAMREYALAEEVVRRAFFHGLLTGYAVGLKCR